jgi:predicted NACHT family NTPase
MSIYKVALERIENNRFKRDNCISFNPIFPRFSEYLPGIQQKRYYLISGASGAGKSQFTDHLFVFTSNEFTENKDVDITFKVFYYSLELDKETKMTQWMTRRLYDHYNIRANINILQSVGKNRLSDSVYMALMETEEYFEKLEDSVVINDNILNPTGIIKNIESYAKNNGKIIKKAFNIKEKQNDGSIIEREILGFDRYIPNNPNEYVIIIVDHASLLNLEQGMAIKQTIEKLSKDFVRLKNRYHYIPVLIQQQAAEGENLSHFKADKLEPNKTNLAESKLTYNDCDIALGIFSPAKHEIKNYRGYNTLEMNDAYRNINIFKNRFGIQNVNTGMYFDGAVNYFKELPKPDQMTQNHYDYIRNRNPKW